MCCPISIYSRHIVCFTLPSSHCILPTLITLSAIYSHHTVCSLLTFITLYAIYSHHTVCVLSAWSLCVLSFPTVCSPLGHTSFLLLCSPGYLKALERGNSVPRPKGFCEVNFFAVLLQNLKCGNLRVIHTLIF